MTSVWKSIRDANLLLASLINKKVSTIVVALLSSTFIVWGLCSCSDDKDDEGYAPQYVEFVQPSNFPEATYTFEFNPLTEESIALGKKLFYDGKLSANGAISCGFCHEQAYAFTHHGHTVSHGISDHLGIRNSPPIQNMAFQKSFMWDGAATHLDLQPIIPITSDAEMGESINNVLAKLQVDAEYPRLFKRAFEDGEVSSENLLKALAQFMVTMVSSNSKYDKYVRGEDQVSLSPTEISGLKTFKDKCSSCHATDLFTDDSYRNNGLAVNPRVNDVGRYRVLEDIDDLYKFKVPSLRNIELTEPYMHDGRFRTLEAVLDFYDNGMVDNGNVDELLRREDGSLGVDLSTEEKHNLIAFLKTLTDDEFINDDRFAAY